MPRPVTEAREATGGGPGGPAVPGGGAEASARAPWLVLASFALVALLAATRRVPEPAAATLLAGLFALAAVRHPAHGLAALVLATPFLLGEPKTPYFWLVPLGAGGLLGSHLAHRLLGRLGPAAVPGPALLGFVAAAILALPLNLRDLLEDLWLAGSLDWGAFLRSGIPDISHLKYLDRVVEAALAAGLGAAAAHPPLARAVLGTLAPLAVLVLALAAFGLARFFGLIAPDGQYLTLSFWTWQHPDLRLTAVAWNPDYLAQFLVLAIPLALVLPASAAPRWQRALGVAAATLGSLALVFTFQRAAWLSLPAALVTYGLLLARSRAPRWPWRRLLAVTLGVVLVAAALDAVVLGGRAAARVGRLTEDPNRLQLWAAALRMAWAQPLLGVGTGRYAFFFHEYAPPEVRATFGPFWGSAHSTYLHILAEQGLVGLLTFGGLFGTVWLGAARRLPALPPDRAAALAGILAALAGWLTYGLFQFTFRVSAVVLLAFVLAGTAAALAPPPRPPRLAVPWLLAAVALALGLGALRLEVALRRPVSPGYEAGFHRWERQADGRPARWTRGRAALSTPVRGPVMELRFRAPIPGVERRPQRVEVRVDHRPVAVLRLATPDWRPVRVSLPPPAASHVLVEVDVAYTFVPRALGASTDTRRLGVMVGEVAWPAPEG